MTRPFPLLLAASEATVHPLWAAPFVVLLACIALMPLVRRHWWEHHYPKVAIAFAVISAGYYFFVRRQPGPWLHYMEEYVSFIALLGSLYVVSGGVLIRISRKATPLANTVLLLIGSILANVFGTTGASMLLIRPYLRMNRAHVRPYHVVFFIFTVSNVGGGLTPIGDPPLFLGYLQGVPFWWVFEQCRVIWALTLGLILAVFFVIDTLEHGKFERRNDADPGPAVHIVGFHNFLFIALILVAVFRPGLFQAAHDLAGQGFSLRRLARLILSREVLMLVAILGSRRFTSREVYERNEFTWGPIREVAILFIAIFSTMVPALEYLRANARQFGIRTPGQYYFMSGGLSAALDNAPTYLTFLELKLGIMSREDTRPIDAVETTLRQMSAAGTTEAPEDLPPDVRRGVETYVRNNPAAVRAGSISRKSVEIAYLISDGRFSVFLVAISMGSVFFGACTYIGNGPNFMVKSIADSLGMKTPGFIGYVFKYTLPVLVPIYVLVWWLFLWA